jgi:ubiquinone/menaquinone biosynthesis C-methylase UbiE
MGSGAMSDFAYDKPVAARYDFFVHLFLYPQGIRSFVFKEIPLRAGEKILDAGCGFGILSQAVARKIAQEGIAGVKQHAFDLSADMLDRFRKRNDFAVDLRRLDVRTLPYRDGYFDKILSAAMLEYVPEVEEALASLRRALRPGGHMYIFMSRRTALNDFLFKPFGHPRCYTPQKLGSVLRGVGFSRIEQQRFPSSYFWLNVWGYILKATK